MRNPLEINQVRICVTGMRDIVVKSSRAYKHDHEILPTLFWVRKYEVPGGTLEVLKSFSPKTWRKDAFVKGTPQHVMRPCAKEMAEKIFAALKYLGVQCPCGRKLPEDCWPRTRETLDIGYMELFPPEKMPDDLI